MRTTGKHLKIFKKEFLLWVEKFGLKEYNCFFHHESLELTNSSNFCCANLHVDDNGKTATVTLATDLPSYATLAFIKTLAKHEAAHLLLRKLVWLGKCRYLGDGELQNEEESVVCRLEKVL